MSLQEMILHYLPMWLLGLFMIFITIKSGNKDILKINKPSVVSWAKFLVISTVLKAIFMYFTWNAATADQFSNISWIPWQLTLTVWWEDAAHTLPLFLLYRLIGTSKKTWPIHALAFLIIWLAFLSGHLYQGFMPAVFISMYIPFSLYFARSRGIGTMMVNHVLYDFSTIILVQGMLRIMHG